MERQYAQWQSKSMTARVCIWLCLIIYITVQPVTAQGQTRTLKVLTFNILHGANTDNSFDLDRIADIITSSGADLVALQEVDWQTKRSHEMDIILELAIRTRMVPYFAQAMAFDGGGYGTGILSRWPLLSAKHVNLPYAEGHEPRTLAVVQVSLPSGDTIIFTSTHLDHLPDSPIRLEQAKAIHLYLDNQPYPTILAGDLNDVPGSEAMQQFQTGWMPSDTATSPAPTIPSDQPRKKIDYILTRPKGTWKVLRSEVLCDSLASDHCALLSVLQLH